MADFTAQVEQARAAAESLMLSTCTITRTLGERTWDEQSGTYSEPVVQVIYSDRCKVQNNTRSINEVLAGERRAGIDSLELHLPVDGTGGIRRDDVARIDSNPPDPALVGRELIVQAEAVGSIKTARRLSVEAVH